MLKTYYCSDLHLEFEKGNTHTMDVPTGDVLLLAGDVYLPWEYSHLHKTVVNNFFAEVQDKFQHVLYVMGNHEHYHGYFANTVDRVKNQLAKYSVNVLNNETVVLEDTMYFGSTFWTDMKGSHPEVMWDCQRGMSDYHHVQYSEDSADKEYYGQKVKLRTEDTVNENFYSRQKLREFMTVAEEKCYRPVVMTHHQPDWECVEAYYRMDNLSYAYANTGLSDYLCDFPKHDWVCGHMHKRNSLVLGNSTVHTNARGYVGIEATNQFAFKELK